MLREHLLSVNNSVIFYERSLEVIRMAIRVYGSKNLFYFFSCIQYLYLYLSILTLQGQNYVDTPPSLPSMFVEHIISQLFPLRALVKLPLAFKAPQEHY